MRAITGVQFCLLLAMAVLDARTRRIPNGLVLVGFASVIAGMPGHSPANWLDSAAWGTVATAPLLCVHVMDSESMGAGDVKACWVIGLSLGARGVLVVPVACVLSAAWIVGVALCKHEQIERTQTIAFGPFLAAGTLAASGC